MILAGRGLRTVREVSVVHDLAVSPDGRLLATAGADGVVRLRDARTWALRRALRGHTDAVNSVDFNGDGTELVTTSRDHDVRIWDVATGRLERLLRWHFGPVADAAFSADGRWLVTAGPSTAGIGLAAGREAFRPGTYLRGPTRPLTAVGFGGSSGLVVFAAARDGLFRTFTCDFCGDVRQLMALARVRLARAG
jgi:WD40 repeat protein